MSVKGVKELYMYIYVCIYFVFALYIKNISY